MRYVFRNGWTLLLAGFLVSGCAARENQMLDEARAAYTAASSDPQLVANAPTELKEAADTLQEAENLFAEDEESDQVTHQAYLARQRVAIAREAAELKLAQEVIASAETQRQDVLLQARSREAQTARQQAEVRQKELEESRLQAQERGQEAEMARQKAAQQTKEMQELRQEMAELQAQPTERGIVLTLKDVVFSVDQAELKPGAERVIDKVAEFLKNHPERTVAVEGFTDATGPEEYNKELSEQRAQAVREALVQRGIDPQRIITRGYGEQYPVASNETPAGRQLNRRVEIIISNGEEQVSMR